MSTLDVIVFFGYAASIVAVGLAHRVRGADSRELFLAGRSLAWLPLGLSVMVTNFTAVNYAAFPAEVGAQGLYVLAALPAFVIVAVPVTRWVIPFYLRLDAASAYEFLEKRFDVRVRCLASALFILWRIFWMAVALYASGRIFHGLTGLDARAAILLTGGAAAAYTALGGLRAVVWTDVAQFAVLLGSALAATGMAVARTQGGWAGLLQTAEVGGRLKPFVPFDPAFFSLDPTVRISFWSGLFGATVAFLVRYGADHMSVQRYLAARSARDAVRGFWLNTAAALATLGVLTVLGLATHAHSAAVSTARQAGLAPLAALTALLQSLPGGFTGLVAAGLMAATMSSVDSGINACCAAYAIDFYERFRAAPAAPDRGGSPAARNRLMTLAVAGVSVALAFYVGRLGSLFEIMNRLVNGIGSPLLALVVLGMSRLRLDPTGVFVGGLVGAALSLGICLGIESMALHYYAVANLAVSLLVGLAAGRAFLWGRPPPGRA